MTTPNDQYTQRVHNYTHYKLWMTDDEMRASRGTPGCFVVVLVVIMALLAYILR